MDGKFIAALEAIRDRTTFDLIDKGYEYEMIFYILAGIDIPITVHHRAVAGQMIGVPICGILSLISGKNTLKFTGEQKNDE